MPAWQKKPADNRLRNEEKKGKVYMKRSSKLKDWSTEYGRSVSRTGFSKHPTLWMTKWILGGIVLVLYMAIRLAVDIVYYYVFLPWRES
jgi:hypothetical protein